MFKATTPGDNIGGNYEPPKPKLGYRILESILNRLSDRYRRRSLGMFTIFVLVMFVISAFDHEGPHWGILLVGWPILFFIALYRDGDNTENTDVSGTTVEIKGNDVIVDGVVKFDIPPHITEIRFSGSVDTIISDRSVYCDYVMGNVEAGGDVTCDDISGDVTAGGSITCDDVSGNVEAGGDVTCEDVSGNVVANNDVTCDDVGGNVVAGSSVECDDVSGNVTARVFNR